MNKLIFLFFLLIIAQFQAQTEKIYIATAKSNKNIENYLKEVDSSIVLIDFMKVDKKKWNATLKKCKGLILCGGYDIHPKNYGLDSLENYCVTEPARDKIELLLLNNAMNDSLPILGICRGMQLLNVYFGGQLCVDIPTFCANDSVIVTHRDPKEMNDVIHPVVIYTNSDLYKIIALPQTKVNSWHHQSVSELSKKMRIGATSPDGSIEAIEWKDGLEKRWILGVQWHPERYYVEQPENLLIMKEFVKQVK
jgi:putative glutamine amidotransferase